MKAYGESKHQDKLLNEGHKPSINKIYSYSTMKNYLDSGVHFTKWAQEQHGCRTLEEARPYTGEYLRDRTEQGLSAWTVHRDAAALAKLYQCKSTELGAELPPRRRCDITQHRDPSTWKGHFSEANHRDLVETAQACGLRRHELAALRPEDVQRTDDGRCIVHVVCGKGGKERYVKALSDAPARAAEAAAAEGRDKIFEHISKYAPIHAYRADYAQAYYAEREETNEDPDQHQLYVCRGDDRSGDTYDRQALLETSREMGHNRLDVMMSYTYEK